MSGLVKRKTLINNKIKILLFIFLTILFYFVPYTHDDWAWGSNIGLERLSTLFDNYNGRWAGNLLIILLTRSRVLKAICISITMIFIVELINKIINRNNNQLTYIISILIFLMPYNIISQTVGWTSGFTNYVVPVLLILIYIYLNNNMFLGEEGKKSNKLLIPMFILGMTSALFMENLTIYILCLSIFILLYKYKKTKKIDMHNLIYFIGVFLGTILMFSNEAYRSVISSEDSYRTIEQGNIFIRSFNTYFNIIYKYLIQNNLVLNIFTGILSLVLICNFYKQNKVSKGQKILLSIFLTMILGYLLYTIFVYVCNNDNIFIREKYKNYLEGIGVLIFWVSVILTSIITIKDKSKKFRILFDIFSIIIITAPLFIVTPIGPRCFFASYIFFAMINAELFDAISKRNEQNINMVFNGIIIIILLFYLIIFGYIFKIETIRNQTIRNTKGIEDEIVLPKLPFEKYMWGANPTNEVFVERFKLFYKIDNETKLIFEPYKDWNKQNNEQ